MKYFQTWGIVAKWPAPLKKFTQYLCKQITGHEISKTERGYDGGKYVDRWCRWCNQRIRIPACEEPSDPMVKLWDDLEGGQG